MMRLARHDFIEKNNNTNKTPSNFSMRSLQNQQVYFQMISSKFPIYCLDKFTTVILNIMN